MDEGFYNHWEPKSGLIYYYGEGYKVGNCGKGDLFVTSKNNKCEGITLVSNRKLKVCQN